MSSPDRVESAVPRRADPWMHLAGLTPARVALGRAGGSVPTRPLLDFQLAHARARDAVQAPFDPRALADQIAALGHPVMRVESAAGDKRAYLLRPDLGRMLSDSSRERLVAEASRGAGWDVVLIVSDGLSALAAHRQAVPTLAALLPELRAAGWRVAPVVVAAGGRVALEDEIGQRLGAQLAVILLGERPGLGAPDSLGAYLVYEPRVGRTDAERNCVSNIRPEGLPPPRAARRLFYLLSQARHHHLSGVRLKDESDLLDGDDRTTSFPAASSG